MNQKNKHTSFQELSELIVSAINDEPFFTKDVLIPKVRAIMKGFHANLAVTAYNKLESPSDQARRLRSIEVNKEEKCFWKTKCQQLYKGDMQYLYTELSEHMERKGMNEN